MSQVVRFRSRASIAAFDPPSRLPRPPFGMGHNQGPPLGGKDKLMLWSKALDEAWKAPPLPVLKRRMKLAAECGLTYREYTLEILERGRWLNPKADAARIAVIIAERDPP